MLRAIEVVVIVFHVLAFTSDGASLIYSFFVGGSRSLAFMTVWVLIAQNLYFLLAIVTDVVNLVTTRSLDYYLQGAFLNFFGNLKTRYFRKKISCFRLEISF